MPRGHYNRENTIRWSKDQDEAMNDIMGTGVSHRTCAAALNVQYPGARFTRNAVIGRCHRLGIRSLKKAPSPGFGNPPRIKRTPVGIPSDPRRIMHAKIRRENTRDAAAEALPKAKRPRTVEEIKEARKGKLPEIVEATPTTSKPFFESERNECKWPTSTNVRCMEVCGAPATFGAYCDHHGQVAYRLGPTAGRNAAYHKTDMEHSKRLEHDLDTADQDVIPMFIGHGGADALLLEDHSQQDFEDANP